MILTPGCKVNLGLRVGAGRADGYHDLLSVFYPLSSPNDELRIELSGGSGLTLLCANVSIRTGDNLVRRAYDVFSKATGMSPGIKVTLEKGVPIGAGLGGGSADAAVFLNWLNDYCGKALTASELWNMAAKLGADAPFFLLNKAALVQGRGEIINSVPFAGGGVFLVLVWPEISISTAWAFSALDEWRARAGKCLTYPSCEAKGFIPSSSGVINDPLALDLRNDLEQPVFKAYPALCALKDGFLDLGARHAAMSGSGSSIYGLFEDEITAMRAQRCLLAKYRHVFFTPLENTGM